MLEGSPNFYASITLEPGKRYYYRSVATKWTYGVAQEVHHPCQ